MLAGFLAFFIMLSIVEGALLIRASKRLLQFDDVFQGITPVLEGYSSELKRMSSVDLNGILADHPEVLAFYKTNQAHKAAIESVVDSVTKMTPPREKPSRLPKPEWE